MRLQKYLVNEEYECRIKDGSNSYEVFKNPSSKDIRDIKNGIIKFIVDSKNKSVYVWSLHGPLHEKAWRQISGRRLLSDIYSGRIIAGYSSIINGKLKMDGSDGDYYVRDLIDNMTPEEYEGYVKKWKWADRYVNITDYLKYDLNEEYKGRVQSSYTKGSAEVFKNPNNKEMKDAAKGRSFRFIADSTDESLWIWNSDLALHVDVWKSFKELNKGRSFIEADKSLKVLSGVAKMMGSRAVMTDCNNIGSGYSQPDEEEVNTLRGNMKWLKRIDIDTYIRDYLE